MAQWALVLPLLLPAMGAAVEYHWLVAINVAQGPLHGMVYGCKAPIVRQHPPRMAYLAVAACFTANVWRSNAGSFTGSKT
jgi:hypothetical protein